MSNTSKPRIVLVHGAWHVPGHYQTFISILQCAGYETHCPALPSCINPTKAGFQDDVDTIRNLITELVNAHIQVVLLLHSYGGAVGSEAAVDLSIAERSAIGVDGGIVHLIYMCAFLLQPGESVASASLPRPDPEPLEFLSDGTTFLRESPKHLFYLDVDENMSKTSVSMLVHHSGGATTTAVKSASWKTIPFTYLFCSRDMAISPDWQQRQIRAVENTGVKVETWTYDSSHSPYLSMPEKMLEAIDAISSRYEK